MSWRNTVPQLAFLSSILAVTSLHLAILHPSQKYYNAALHHHTEALARFRLHLSSITPKNLSSVFAFSCLIPLFAFGVHCTPLRRLDTLPGIYEIFTLLSFISTLLKSSTRWLDPHRFPEVAVPVVRNPSASLPEPIESSLTLLSARNQTTSDELVREASVGAIDLVRTSFLIA
jgi:hypothetical protein